MSFGGALRGRRVLVTGHTGFKGAWLSAWLGRLGARVTGLSLPAQRPSLFAALHETLPLVHREADVRDAAAVQAVLDEARPELVFHLAAQALVRTSYDSPKATFDVNVGGTVNVLEAVRCRSTTRAVIVVTSDKAYENDGRDAPYREEDRLGGHDPYSASKGAAELVVASYRRSFFAPGTVRPGGAPLPRLLAARAGNVIGGGDFAADRVVPDCVRALLAGAPVRLRNPEAVRPWQHVLEPLSGYLWLAARALSATPPPSDAYNFGPAEAAPIVPVREVVERFLSAWGSGSLELEPTPAGVHEARALRLDSSRAAAELGWRPVWSLDETIERTARFYRTVAAVPVAAPGQVQGELARYEADARARGLAWAQEQP